ncbi:coiled-coil domain-containing protein 96-like isoform X2 [Diorhabda carinulata]|uniref:coiled-coil domain-containing protein 96-like isoform X2 n=1 Tax=Diorhabda carinulata TaxID=1163345 RepID=UPI0025A21D57|nr:coiled-coil domain-containing protein 96-like isoform X2 [Diorhabda carinulata]
MTEDTVDTIDPNESNEDSADDDKDKNIDELPEAEEIQPSIEDKPIPGEDTAGDEQKPVDQLPEAEEIRRSAKIQLEPVDVTDEKHELIESTIEPVEAAVVKETFQEDKTVQANFGTAISNAFLDTMSYQEIHKKVIFAEGSDKDLFQDTDVKSKVPDINFPERYSIEIDDNVSEDNRRMSVVSESDKKKRKRRKSKSSTKSIVSYTLGYNFSERFNGPRVTEGVNISDSNPWDTPTVIENLEASSAEQEEEEEEEEESTLTSISTALASRSFYYEKLRLVSNELKYSRIFNQILQKKLAVYYRQKNMLHAFKEDETGIGIVNKYHILLNKFEEVCIHDRKERDKMSRQFTMIRNKKEATKIKLDQIFKDFQDREREIGIGLIHTKTGNEIPEKYVEHLLNRQKFAAKNISEMRLTWLQLKNMVEEKEEAIADIDKIDDNHTLTGYEKLKADYFMLFDKLEERLGELTKVRFTIQNTIQMLAHFREKISALNDDINELGEEDQELNRTYNLYRMKVANLKMERDSLRRSIVKIKEESGLLIHNNLLRDMENCIEEVKQLKIQMNTLKNDCITKAKQVKNLRSKILERNNYGFETKHVCGKDSVKCRKKRSVTNFQKTLSTYNTKIPTEAFDYIKQDFQLKGVRIKFDEARVSSEK